MKSYSGPGKCCRSPPCCMARERNGSHPLPDQKTKRRESTPQSSSYGVAAAKTSGYVGTRPSSSSLLARSACDRTGLVCVCFCVCDVCVVCVCVMCVCVLCVCGCVCDVCVCGVCVCVIFFPTRLFCYAPKVCASHQRYCVVGSVCAETFGLETAKGKMKTLSCGRKSLILGRLSWLT